MSSSYISTLRTRLQSALVRMKDNLEKSKPFIQRTNAATIKSPEYVTLAIDYIVIQHEILLILRIFSAVDTPENFEKYQGIAVSLSATPTDINEASIIQLIGVLP